jgi:hypothetical protein
MVAGAAHIASASGIAMPNSDRRISLAEGPLRLTDRTSPYEIWSHVP